MNEKTWLAERDDSWAMINFLDKRVSARKAQLFACACFRLQQPKCKKWEFKIIEVAERYADGLASEAEKKEAEDKSVGSSGVAWALLANDYWTAVEAARVTDARMPDELQCDLVRDVFGNPFRKVKFDKKWRTDTAVQLARQMYDSRDFGAMPILADALQDAGCDAPAILDHCRGEGLHVRGCWAIDGVLGKA